MGNKIGQNDNYGTCGEFEGFHEVFDEDERSELEDGRVEPAQKGGAGVARLVLGHRHVHVQIRLKNAVTCSLNLELYRISADREFSNCKFHLPQRSEWDAILSLLLEVSKLFLPAAV